MKQLQYHQNVSATQINNSELGSNKCNVPFHSRTTVAHGGEIAPCSRRLHYSVQVVTEQLTCQPLRTRTAQHAVPGKDASLHSM